MSNLTDSEKEINVIKEKIRENRLEIDNLDTVLNEILKELESAISKFGKFNNAHEGYAVLLEEMDELWENVKLNQKTPNRLDMIRFEAIHVGAMAIRIIIDCCEGIE